MAATPAFAQAAAQPAKIDAADTAWMISATGLVLMMSIPGLALFYSGMVRKKNVLATMAQTLAAVALGSILWMVVGYSLAFTGDGPADRHVRAPVPERHGHERDQPARQDHPGIAVHALPDDLRGHHGGAGRRLGRRPHALLGLSLVRRRLADAGLCADRALGVGRRFPRHRRRAGFRRRHRGASERRHRRPGRLLAARLAARLRHRQSRALRSVARGDRHRPAVGRLVRLQRRLGARRQFARRLRHRWRRISRPAPAC